MRFHGESKVDPARLMALVSAAKGAQFTPAGVLRLPIDGQGTPEQILEFLKQTLTRISQP